MLTYPKIKSVEEFISITSECEKERLKNLSMMYFVKATKNSFEEEDYLLQLKCYVELNRDEINVQTKELITLLDDPKEPYLNDETSNIDAPSEQSQNEKLKDILADIANFNP